MHSFWWSKVVFSLTQKIQWSPSPSIVISHLRYYKWSELTPENPKHPESYHFYRDIQNALEKKKGRRVIRVSSFTGRRHGRDLNTPFPVNQHPGAGVESFIRAGPHAHMNQQID